MQTIAAEAATLSSFENNTPWLRSDALVTDMQERQRADIARLGFPPHLAIVLGNRNKANISYALQLQRHGQAIGATVTIHETPSEKETARKVRRLNKDYLVHSVFPMLDEIGPEAEQAIRAAMFDPRKDLDAINTTMPPEHRLFTPGTPEAMVVLAESHLGHDIDKLHPDELVVNGNGPKVGGPLFDLLKARGVEPGTVLRTKDEIIGWREAIQSKVADGINKLVIFTAVPVGNLIDARELPDLPESTMIIDAGNGKVAGTPNQFSSNVDPNTVARHGLVRTTPFKGGVGPVTTAIIFDRLIQTTREQTARSVSYRPPRTRRLGSIAMKWPSLLPKLSRKPELAIAN